MSCRSKFVQNPKAMDPVFSALSDCPNEQFRCKLRNLGNINKIQFVFENQNSRFTAHIETLYVHLYVFCPQD